MCLINQFSCGDHVKVKIANRWEPATVTFGNPGLNENEICTVLLYSGKKIEISTARIELVRGVT